MLTGLSTRPRQTAFHPIGDARPSPDDSVSETAIKILLVDRRPTRRLAHRQALRAAGFEVLEATDGAQALTAAAQGSLAVVVLSTPLSDLATDQAVEAIRALACPPKIVLHSEIEIRPGATQLGDFIDVKQPAQPEDILRAVEKAARAWLQAGLWRSEERYRSLASAAPVGIYRTNAKGLYTDVNDRFTKITGISVSSGAPRGWVNATHPDDQDRVQRTWYRCLAEELPVRDRFRILLDDGSIRWVESRAFPMRSPTGAVVGYLGTLVDQTRAKLAEDSLRILDTAFAHLLVPVAVLSAGRNTAERRFVFANRAFLELMGYEEDEVFGHTASLFYGPRTESKALRDRNLAMGHGSAFTDELTLHHKSGRALKTTWRLDPVKDSKQEITHWTLSCPAGLPADRAAE